LLEFITIETGETALRVRAFDQFNIRQVAICSQSDAHLEEGCRDGNNNDITNSQIGPKTERALFFIFVKGRGNPVHLCRAEQSLIVAEVGPLRRSDLLRHIRPTVLTCALSLKYKKSLLHPVGEKGLCGSAMGS